MADERAVVIVQGSDDSWTIQTTVAKRDTTFLNLTSCQTSLIGILGFIDRASHFATPLLQLISKSLWLR